MHTLLQNLIFGIQLGSLYALIALGYTMVYGVLRLINFAHGDVCMVGAFVGYYACTGWLPFKDLTVHPEAGWWNTGLAIVVLLIVMAASALLGVLIERFAYRPFRNGLGKADAHFWGFAAALPVGVHFAAVSRFAGCLSYLVSGIALGFMFRPAIVWLSKHNTITKSRLNALITAIGVSLLLENGGLKVFGADPNFIPTMVPERTLALPGGLTVQSGQLAIFVVSLVLMGILRYIVGYTRRGRAMRAISYDIEAAKLMGVDTDSVISFTFALGAALAGAAGIMIAGLTHFKITPLFGLQPGIKAFVAAVVGGAGNIPGAALGGLVMGIVEALVAGSKYTSYQDAVAFLVLIVVLLVRPSGLLGKSSVEKV